MKIAIASTGKDENAKVSPISGRAEYYLIFEDKKLIKVIKNPFAIGGGGAGPAAAQMLANEGVEMIISGHFGEKMLDALKEKGIKTKTIKEKTVKEALMEI